MTIVEGSYGRRRGRNNIPSPQLVNDRIPPTHLECAREATRHA